MKTRRMSIVMFIIMFAGLFNIGAPNFVGAAVPVSSKRIVGYFVQWGIYKRNYLVKNVDTSGSAERLTHINYAFADIDDTLKCATADSFADYNKAFSASETVNGIADQSSDPVKGNFKQLYQLKQKYPHLKILISVGGWTLSTNFSDAALPANRAAFVSSCIDMYLKGIFAPGKVLPGVFDGIDLDWEYPSACGLTCNFRPEDKQNFTALLAEFRSQMNTLSQQTGKTYLLTAATSAGEGNIAVGLELNNIHQYMDWINVMTYDFHGGWDTATNLHSPLFGNPADPTFAQHSWSDYAMDLYIAGGVPASKLTMGVPFYGRGWGGVPPGPNGDGLYQVYTGKAPRGKYEDGVDDYKEMIAREATFTKYFNPIAQSVHIYNGSTLWTYDDPASMTNKMNYINSTNLSGVMFWELSGDTTSIALLNAIYNGLNGVGPTSTPGGPTNTPTRTNTPAPPTNTPTVGPSPTPTNTPVPSSFHSPSGQAAGPGGDANGFESNPANAFSDNASFAVDVDSGLVGSLNCTDANRDKHDFFNYGISAGATINGIEVRLDAKVDKAMNSAALCVQLSPDGGTTWTTAKTTPALTTSEATYILGGATDTWGRTWTATELSNANFRVRVTSIANANVRDFSLDWAAVKVSSQ